jgi:D-sedoheptulose 7-phosphate isomerase|tara:strand:+ start:8850 stop:9497 length:648 start_codon:yes stop_codon:yes gene_type:complete
MSVDKMIEDLVVRNPELGAAKNDIYKAFELLKNSYENSGKLLICGNGGSAADADHIVGELMKRFSIPREIPKQLKNKLLLDYGEKGKYMSDKLEGSLPAISLNTHSALSSAFANDVDAELIYAQQVVGYGNMEDVLLGISTSGNAKNVISAMIVAKAKGMKVLGLVGRDGGEFKKYCDVLINVGGNSTPQIQELHLPVYHVLCQTLEYHFFGKIK